MTPGGKAEQTADRRNQRRIEVGLPMLVRGTDRHGQTFEDTAHSYDVSRTGASFLSRRELGVGMMLEIIIPRASNARPGDADFVSQARVVRLVAIGDGREVRVGVNFVGPRFHRVFFSEYTGGA